MNSFASIRQALQATQGEIAKALGVTQGNISFYEKGQTVPPKVAARLIAYAKSKGKTITFDEVYAAESERAA